MIRQFSLLVLEKAINAYLKLDAQSLSTWALYQGKVIQLEITDWNVAFFVLIKKEGVELSCEPYAAGTHCVIRGALWQLFRVGIAKASTEATLRHPLEITGDIELGQHLQKVMQNLDVDWQEQLSKLTGDSIAFMFSQGICHTFSTLKRSVGLVQKNMSAYLQQESKLLPSNEEIKDFRQQVETLRDDVARLEAHFFLLEMQEAPIQ